MTRTERDLRAVLEASEQQAPDPTAVLDALKRRIVTRGRRRRSTIAYVAAAVAVGAVAMVPTVLRSSGSVGVTAATPSSEASAEPSSNASPTPPSTPSTTPSPMATVARPFLSFTVRPGDAGNGIRIEPAVITANRQWALVRQSGVVKGVSAELYVYEPGRLDVARYLTGEALTVNGHPGYFKVAADPDPTNPVDRATVVWQYTPGAWALVMSTQDLVQREQLLQIATSLVLDTPVSATVPFKLGYLPAGLRAVRLSQGGSTNLSATVTFDVAGADLSTIDNETGRQRPLQIIAMPPVPRMWNPTGTVAGYPMTRISTSQVAIDVGGWWIELDIGTGTPPPITDADIERIMAGMSLATLTDPTTWFDATTAIPGGS